MSDPFVHLHVHSEYSMLDGYGHPSQFFERAKQLGQTALAVTDHGNVSAHKRWYDEGKKVGIKPLLGVEAYVCDDASKKTGRTMWHITLLAKDLVGYRNLLKVVTHSWLDGFYYKPRTDWEMLRQCSKGLIATSGCPSGRIGRGISKESWDTEAVVKELKRQADIFDDYYVELSPWQYDEGINIASSVYKAALSEDMPMVLTMDAHYPCEHHAHVQDVMLCIQNNVKFSDPSRMKFSQTDFCLHSGNEMAAKWFKIHGKRLPGLDEMLSNTRKIADSVDFEFPSAVPLAFKHDGDHATLLRELCERGMKLRKLHKKREYRERLEYEFELICSKNFVDYFLVVSDLIVWAKDNGILVGAARGSSCGSLMCYLLRITEVDPLVHGLMVERFIDITRKDLPDIDIDFESERRNEVKVYLEGKYGQDNVANLATFGTFKGKLCLQDIGRVFSDTIPWEAVEETKRLIVQRSSADSRYGFTIEDTFVNFEQAAEHLRKYPELGIAKELEGQIRQLGVHAAGVVISNEPIGNFAAMYKTKNGDRVISMDYSDASSVGLLKIDVLGLTALTAMKRTLALIKKRHNKVVDIGTLPLDDKATYDNFCKQNLLGIFQFEGESTRQVCRQVQPRTFQDLVAINALSRPGPLHSGNTTSFIERRCGREKNVPIHAMIDEVTHNTNGMIIYQEQVMQIVRIMGRFDWSGIATVRKMMSKKYGDEAFGAMRDKFVAGATSQGVTEKDALLVWKNICTHGAWSFNKSHSVAYSIMAYQLMWLKTHFPIEFYASIIGCETDFDKQRRLFKEYAKESGRPTLPVDINLSGKEVTCGDHGLRLGFDAVVKFGSGAIAKVLANQPYKDYVDFTRRCKLPAKQADKLLKIGAFRNLKFTAVSAQQDLFGAHLVTNDGFDYTKPQDQFVREFCPLAADNRVNEQWSGWLKDNTSHRLWTIDELDTITEKTDVMIMGFTNPGTSFNLKNKMEEAASKGREWEPREGEEDLTREQYNFLNFNIEDETDSIIVRIGYKLYPRYKDMMWKLKAGDALAVRGMYLGTMRMVFATSVVSLVSLKTNIANETCTKNELKFLGNGVVVKKTKKHREPPKVTCAY